MFALCVHTQLHQVSRANFNEDPYVRDFGIGIDTKMVNVTGRILPPPLLQYGGKVKVCVCVCGETNVLFQFLSCLFIFCRTVSKLSQTKVS